MFKGFSDSMMEFHNSFESDRSSLSETKPSPEEWEQWHAGWRAKGEAKGAEFRSSLDAFIEAKGLADCRQYIQPPPMGAQAGPGGPPPGDRYGEAPPQDDRFFQGNEESRRLMEECGAKIFELLGPPPSQGGKEPTPELQAKAHEIMKKCQKQARENFHEVYKQEFEDGEHQGRGAGEHFGSFSIFGDEESGELRVTGKYLSLTGNEQSQMMTGVRCGGQDFIDRLFVKGYLEDFGFEQTGEGTALKIKAAGTVVLQIHDNPRCPINVSTGGTIEEITLDLADYLDVEKTDKGIKFSDGEVDGTVLVHEGTFELGEGNELVLGGKATFLVSNSAGAQASGSSLANDLNLKAALEEGNIGAEIIIAAGEEGEKADATPYGDLEVEVDTGSESEVSVTVDSESEEGKTIVLVMDEEVLEVDDLEDVTVEVFDVAEETVAEGNLAVDSTETEACTREADNLRDVLDPNDDGDCNEYWVVIDKLGTQVLVSNAHYSEKRISIQSTSDAEAASGFIPGIGFAFVAALMLIAVAARRDD